MCLPEHSSLGAGPAQGGRAEAAPGALSAAVPQAGDPRHGVSTEGKARRGLGSVLLEAALCHGPVVAPQNS